MTDSVCPTEYLVLFRKAESLCLPLLVVYFDVTPAEIVTSSLRLSYGNGSQGAEWNSEKCRTGLCLLIPFSFFPTVLPALEMGRIPFPLKFLCRTLNFSSAERGKKGQRGLMQSFLKIII
jgi:hypothetical protein